MDDAGNIEPSQAPNPDPKSPVCPEEESADVWGDSQDENEYLTSLEDFERTSGEISDQLLLACMTDFDQIVGFMLRLQQTSLLGFKTEKTAYFLLQPSITRFGANYLFGTVDKYKFCTYIPDTKLHICPFLHHHSQK